MRRRNYIYFLVPIALLPILYMGCKKPYNPPLINSTANFLVVDGVINTSLTDSTIIKLSRTVPLSGKVSFKPETNAVVYIETTEASYNCIETSPGRYSTPALTFSAPGGPYRLRIITSDQVKYDSDLIKPKANPPIDSIGFTAKPDFLQIYVNAHDPNNATRYYRWEYQETWQFHAKYASDYVSDEKTGLYLRQQQIYQCFGNNPSTTIVLGSTARLKEDVIYQNPVTEIPSTSEKLETKYSILLKQYALTEEEFNFWQNLKKNTEQLGSVFDPQPSTSGGNMHCTSDPKIPVIGYIGATNIQQKRIFISNTQVPPAWFPDYPYAGCKMDTVENADVAFTLIYPPIVYLATHKWLNNFGQAKGFYYTTPECADCTIRGATAQPDFWR